MKRTYALAWLLLALFGCAGPGDGPDAGQRAAALAPLLDLDLSGAESSVREQLAEQRSVVDELLARPDADAAATAEAFADLGLLYVTYEFLEPAEVCFANALELAPGDFRWSYLLGYLKMIQGVLPEAVGLYERALELEPEYLPAVLRLGRSELGLGRPEAARPWFERALELDPNAAAAHEGLGKTADTAGDDEAAIGHFERALELDPNATSLHYALAQSYRNLGRLDEARGRLARAGDVAARISDPLINPLANLAESAQFYMMQGAEAMDDQDYEAAAGAFRAALERDAESFAAYRGLAISLEHLGDVEGAEATLERSLAAVPEGEGKAAERAQVLRSLGALAALSGREAVALERYLQSLALAPDQPSVLLLTANALARAGRLEEAVEHFDRLLALEPRWAPAVLEKRATALVNLGRSEEAVADFTHAVEAAPGDRRLRQRFAAALDYLGRGEEAAAQRRALEALPASDAERAAEAAGEAQRRAAAGDFEAAAERFREALELAPESLETRYALASVLGHTGRYGEAAAELERVIAAAPRRAEARRAQVVALVLAGRYGEARIKLQEALATFPRNVGFALVQVRLLAIAPDPRVRDGNLALAIAERVWAERRDAPARQALAFAEAAAGNFPAAAALQRELLAEAESAGDAARVELARSRLAAFERGVAWTAKSPEEILNALGAGG